MIVISRMSGVIIVRDSNINMYEAQSCLGLVNIANGPRQRVIYTRIERSIEFAYNVQKNSFVSTIVD